MTSYGVSCSAVYHRIIHFWATSESLSNNMNFDPHTKSPIHQDGIWDRSGCLEHEQSVISAVANRLKSLGYQDTDGRQIFWQRHRQKIVLCVVDDVRHVVQDYETDMPYLFNNDTTVITDNQILCPTIYRVANLPLSFFGIYHHDAAQVSDPDRQFSFLINRLDDRRCRLMLELANRIHLHFGYVNFNCQTKFSTSSELIDLTELRQNFKQSWLNLDSQTQRHYQSSFEAIKDLMPVKNYTITHDQAMLRSRCNIVVESYSSDTGIAFSEKIFRALVLPVPWTLYGGLYSIARLQSLGFDCMSDIMDHDHYDRLKQIEDKIHIFIWKTLDMIQRLEKMDQQILAQRCQQAAQHNQALLHNFRQRWPDDFSQWLDHDLS